MRLASTSALRLKASWIFFLISAGAGARLDLDQIADALDALDPAHCGLGRAALVLPLHLAFESHPAVLDDDLDVLRGDRLIAGP